MTAWGSGYVTDVAYMTGYYRQQSPLELHAACLLGGVATDIPRRLENLSYLELGCGRGYGALCLAASNPGWQVTAIDFNPAHIAEARELAEEAALANITFLEADLATLSPDAVPEADVASMHGVWSWVSPAVQQGIVRLLNARLRPGGVLHVSYNALPAWGGGLGLHRLLYQAGTKLGGRSDRQIGGALELLQAMNAAEAIHLQETTIASGLVKRSGGLPLEYLAHEHMNAYWQPCFHADVVAALAPAKLDWVASADLAENFAPLMLTDAQRAVVERTDDPVMRELLKDLCLQRSLRHDVFVRGARRIGRPMRDVQLGELHLSLAVAPDEFKYEAVFQAGSAALSPLFYKPMVDALAEGPRRVGDLLQLPAVEGRRDNPAEVIGMMAGTRQALLVARPGKGTGAAAARLNGTIGARLMKDEGPQRGAALASERLGAGISASASEIVVAALLARTGGAVETERWADTLGLPKEGEARDGFRRTAEEIISRRRMVWRNAGICD